MNCLDCAARENHFLIPCFFPAACDPFGKHISLSDPVSKTHPGSCVMLIRFGGLLSIERRIRTGSLVALSGIRIPSFIPFLILSLFELGERAHCT